MDSLGGGAYVDARRLVEPSFMEQRSVPDPARVLSKWRNAAHAGPTQYGVEGTDGHGDIERNCGSKNTDWNYPIAKGVYEIDPDSIESLKRQFEKWTKRGAKVFISFPSIATDVLATPKFAESTATLSHEFALVGLKTLGEPIDFVFPRQAFFDGRYHLNCNARADRTRVLLRYLKKILDATKD